MKKKFLTVLLLTFTVSIFSAANQSSWPGFIYLNKLEKSKKSPEKKQPQAEIEIQPGAWLL